MSPSKTSASFQQNKMIRYLFFKTALPKLLLSIALLAIVPTPSSSTQSERQIQIPALKRTASLGDLYNEKADEIINVGVFKRRIPTEHIIETQNPTKRTDATILNSFEKQFKLFNIDANEAVNILTGITTARGAAHIVNKNKQPPQVIGAFLHEHETVVQSLWAFYEGLDDVYNKDILRHTRATHVVTSITWGATVAVTLDGSLIKSSDTRKIQNSLNQELQSLSGKLSASDEAESNFSMSITSDIPLPIENPTTAKEVKEILSQVPALIAGLNQGKGIPIQYTLTPINFFREHMSVNTQNLTAHKIDEFTLNQIIYAFQDLRSAEVRIHKIQEQINGHSNCVPSQTAETINTFVSNFQDFETHFTTAIKKSVVEVRSGVQENHVLSEIIEEFRNSEFHLKNLNHRFVNLSNEISKSKVDLCNVIQNEFSQIQYFGADDDLVTKLLTLQKSEKSVYILFANSKCIRNQPQAYTASFNLLLKKQEEETNVCLLVDCDFSDFHLCNNLNDTLFLKYANGTFNSSVGKREILDYSHILKLDAAIVKIGKKVSYLQNVASHQRQTELETESHISHLQHKTNVLEQKLECGLHPCLNGGKCSFRNSRRHCECSAGFLGGNCETSIDDCAGHNSCLNGGTCVDGYNSFACACTEAFVGNHCEHMNECVYPGTCATVSRGARCECREGYVQDPQDSRRCEPVNKSLNENATLIFGSIKSIEQFSLKQGTVIQIQNQISTFRALDFLYRTNTVFWSGDHKMINTAPIRRGASKTVVLNDPGASFLALAVDWVYGHLYFVNDRRDTINVANLDGSMKKVLLTTGVTYTWAIVVDPLSGWIYWADYDAKNIERAGMDGSRREVIKNTSPNSPLGLALDQTQNRLYWTTFLHPASIHSMNVDGSDKKLVFQATQPTFPNSQFWSITTFGDFVYWRDYKTKAVYKTNKCGGGEATPIHLVPDYYDSYRTLQAYHYSKQPEGVNYCANRIGGQCSHLCFPTPSDVNVSVTTKCACPEGYTLSSNQQTCT